MRPLTASPLLPTLIASILLAAVPAAAQVKTGAVEIAPGGSGQAGSSLNSGGVAPVSSLSGGSIVPSLSGSAGLSVNLAAPAANLNQGLTPSVLATAVQPAAASAGKQDKVLPAQAAAALPPNTPPGGGPKAASSGPPFVPPFIETLRRLGVPDEAISSLLPLLTPRSADFATTVAGMAEQTKETPARQVLLILSAALRDDTSIDALRLAERVGAKFGFSDKQVLALSQHEMHENAAEAFPSSDQSWATAWIARLIAAEKSVADARRITDKLTKVAAEHADGLKADRAPPQPGAERDLASARRYISDIMGRRVPTEREIDSLLGDWLAENDIPPNSPRHRAVRAALLPTRTAADDAIAAKLPAPLRPRAALLIRLAAENKTTVGRVVGMLGRRGLVSAAPTLDDETLETQITLGLHAEELEAAVATYPRGEGADLMRNVASIMHSPGGKSVEEIARDGVFVYADFYGSKVSRAVASRDPDMKSYAMAFYVTRTDGKWVIDGYRQNRVIGSSDATLIAALKAWLVAGGVPEEDLR